MSRISSPSRHPAPAAKLVPILLLFPLLALLPTRATGQDASEHELGIVRPSTSCSPAVQDDFDRALALLHHMMYEQSRASFQQIAERDPACAMAHWGVAMTLVQPLWHPADPEALRRGWNAVQRAKERSPATEQARALVAATEALYEKPEATDWWARLQRWSGAMERAHREHPDDIEIAAFYALSKLAAAQAEEDRLAQNARAAEVLLRIHQREPRHPGASHYLIHANDVTGRAGESLEIVRGYDEIAPSVPHALHMPTHIFVRLGEWPEVIEWNRESADAALRFPAGDRISLHYPHAMDYLLYAYLQRGEDQRARAVLEEVRGKGPMQEDFATVFHLAVMPARYAVERRAWEEAAALNPRTPEYLAWDKYPWAEALSWFALGLGAVHTDDLAAAREAETRMQQLEERAEETGAVDHARYIEIDRLILSGEIAYAEGNAEVAVRHMREAAELEGTIQKHPVNPGALLPPYEALGELLLELDRPAEARKAFEASLEIWPERYNAIVGTARAARAAGAAAKAGEYYRQLLEVVEGADTNRPGVQEARDFLDRGS